MILSEQEVPAISATSMGLVTACTDRFTPSDIKFAAMGGPAAAF